MSESVRRNLAELHKTERDQWQLIHESQIRGHAKSVEHSPVRAALIEGRKPFEQDIAERVAQREEEVNQQSNRYWNARRNMLDKIHNRKPIFSLKEVAKAQADLEVQRQNHKKQLQEAEQKQWEHLTELNYAVLDRPLLMESGNPARPDSARRAQQALARRPPRPKSAPNTREQKSELWGDLREEIRDMVETTVAERSLQVVPSPQLCVDQVQQISLALNDLFRRINRSEPIAAERTSTLVLNWSSAVIFRVRTSKPQCSID